MPDLPNRVADEMVYVRVLYKPRGSEWSLHTRSSPGLVMMDLLKDIPVCDSSGVKRSGTGC